MRGAGVENIGCHWVVLFRLLFGGTVVKHGSLARTVGTLDVIRIQFVIITYLLIYILTYVRTYLLTYLDGFGGLVVSMLASGTQFCGFKPGRSRWIFRT